MQLRVEAGPLDIGGKVERPLTTQWKTGLRGMGAK